MVLRGELLAGNVDPGPGAPRLLRCLRIPSGHHLLAEVLAHLRTLPQPT